MKVHGEGGESSGRQPSGRQPMVSGEEARKAVDLILAIYEPARKGEMVYL